MAIDFTQYASPSAPPSGAPPAAPAGIDWTKYSGGSAPAPASSSPPSAQGEQPSFMERVCDRLHQNFDLPAQIHGVNDLVSRGVDALSHPNPDQSISGILGRAWDNTKDAAHQMYDTYKDPANLAADAGTAWLTHSMGEPGAPKPTAAPATETAVPAARAAGSAAKPGVLSDAMRVVSPKLANMADAVTSGKWGDLVPERVQAAGRLAKHFLGDDAAIDTKPPTPAAPTGPPKLWGKRIPSETPPASPAPAQASAPAPAPRYAFRARDVGEQGVPSQSPSQATMSEGEARGYMQSRSEIQGKPQQLVRVNLSQLDPSDYQETPGPRGNSWIKFNRDLPESSVEPMPDQKGTGQDLTGALQDSLDALKGPKPGQPMVDRGQLAANMGKPTPATNIPAGHTPVNSSAVRSYRYDAGAREFHAAPKSGSTVYVYGDVSPEEADAFQKADSKGKAWQQIRQNPLVAKIVDGKRIATKPESGALANAMTSGR